MGSMSWLPVGGSVLGAQSQCHLLCLLLLLGKIPARDLLGPLPKREGILVEDDYFSRFLKVTVLKSTTSAKIIEASHPMHICLV